jgi:hypothetical protein
MSSIFSKRRRKYIAPLTLVLWLFAVFVSIADACGLDRLIAGQGSPHATVGTATTTTDDPTAPACEQFCADDSPVQAKIKALQDPPSGQALLALAFTGPSLQTSVGSSATRPPCPDPPPGIEATILFLRLAL